MDILLFFSTLMVMVGPVLTTLAGLITVDLLLGVAVALRSGTFKWFEVANFYKTNVLPYGLQAIAAAVFVKFITTTALPAPVLEALDSGGIYLATAPLFAQLVLGSIVPNLRALATGKSKLNILYPELFAPRDATPPGDPGLGGTPS